MSAEALTIGPHVGKGHVVGALTTTSVVQIAVATLLPVVALLLTMVSVEGMVKRWLMIIF